MCLTIVVTLLDSTIDIQLVLSYHFTVGAPVWSAKTSMYLLITFFKLTYLYMHLISPSVDLDIVRYTYLLA